MSRADELRARAKRRHAALQRAWRNPRYRRVLGRFVAAGLLTTTADVEAHREPIEVADALWAGRIEPRILELLPAAIIKRPSLFVDIADLPDDLDAVVRALLKHQTPDEFRGIPGSSMQRWLGLVGRRGKLPSRLKTFRFGPQDIELLEQLSDRLGLTQTEVLRRGLRHLAATQLLER